MKTEYILLDKTYLGESICNLPEDAADCWKYPSDKEYLQIQNKDDESFLAGSYKVLIVFIPDVENGDYVNRLKALEE